jgi:hypothetical protein
MDLGFNNKYMCVRRSNIFFDNKKNINAKIWMIQESIKQQRR